MALSSYSVLAVEVRRAVGSSCSAVLRVLHVLNRTIWPSPAPSACQQWFAGSGGTQSSFLVLRHEEQVLAEVIQAQACSLCVSRGET